MKMHLALPEPSDASLAAAYRRWMRSACQLPTTYDNQDPDENVVVANREKALTGLPYVPDFKKAFAHFCVYAGGRAVIDAIEQNLQLDKSHLEASRDTLFRCVCVFSGQRVALVCLLTLLPPLSCADTKKKS